MVSRVVGGVGCEKGPEEARCSLQLLTSCVVQQGLAGTADPPQRCWGWSWKEQLAPGQRFLLVEVGLESPEDPLRLPLAHSENKIELLQVKK